ncbi:Protein of unknown function [Pyronema omphalodes CBS 100304]|uniref:Uncharacterized protein n=1 Tax=Pyronema omphalodes (strain CBS 100304) TaxID=1076935 RepID=U4LHN4_PYROM|nr:Protein of unknown function [Pyronema omphalodes CBS 100304]
MLDINAKPPGWGPTDDTLFTSLRKVTPYILNSLFKICFLAILIPIVWTLIMWNVERIIYPKKVVKPVPMEHWNKKMGFAEK